MRNLVLIFIFMGTFFVFASALAVENTPALRPVGDGVEDSAAWTNSSGVTCDSTDCYVEVDESSGSECVDTDGDDSYIEGSAGSQTFNLDAGQVPTGATITQVDIGVCYKQGLEGSSNSFSTKFCMERSCETHSDNAQTTNTYKKEVQSHTGFSNTKKQDDNIEIGVEITGASGVPVRVSSIQATIFYEHPTGEGGEALIPPTFELAKTTIPQGDSLEISGQGVSDSVVEVLIDGAPRRVMVDEHGEWSLSVSGTLFNVGEHSVRARQIYDSEEEGPLSPAKVFNISPLRLPQADLNKDGIINITDWSIFLTGWGSADSDIKSALDMNGDSIINVRDFSIFMYNLGFSNL